LAIVGGPDLSAILSLSRFTPLHFFPIAPNLRIYV